jgi:Family of unknown function (DUF6220)
MVTNGLRLGVAALAWLFAAAVVVQVFLAGLSLFDSAAHWADHRTFGSSIAPIPTGIVLLAALGRLPARLIGLALLLFFLYGAQFALAHAGTGYVAALHPVNALVLLGLSIALARRAGRLAAPDRGGPTFGPLATERKEPS